MLQLQDPAKIPAIALRIDAARREDVVVCFPQPAEGASGDRGRQRDNFVQDFEV